MKEADLNRIVSKMKKNPFIRYNGETYFYRDSESQVWTPFPKRELIKQIRKIYLAGTADDSVSNARMLADELRNNDAFDMPIHEKKSRPLVITKCGKVGIGRASWKIESVKETDFETHAFDFSFQREAKWEDAPAFCEYAKTSLGIDLLNDKESSAKRQLLTEILAYAVSEVYGAKKMIIFLGPTNSGKTVLLNLLRNVAGADGYAPLSLEDMSDRFRAAILADVPLILNDEIGGNGIKRLEILKKVISGEPVILEKKGRDPKTCQIHVKPIFAANVLPQLLEYDSGNAFAERLQILYFPKSIPREQWKLDLSERICEEKDVIFSCSIMEANDFFERLRFTDVPDGCKILNAYKEENATVQSFISDCCILGAGMYEYTNILYEKYLNFCDSNCHRSIPRKMFRDQLIQSGFEICKGRVPGGPPLSRVSGIKLKEAGFDDQDEIGTARRFLRPCNSDMACSS